MKIANVVLALCLIGCLCVTLLSVEVVPTKGGAVVKWETAMEFNVAGFNLYRSNCPTCKLVKVNKDLIPASYPGQLIGDQYTFRVKGHQNAWYRLEIIDLCGNSTIYDPVRRP